MLAAQLRKEQLDSINAFFKPALCATICVNPADGGGTNVDVWLHDEFAAHAWPSGAAQDRRAWLELTVNAGDTELAAQRRVAKDQAVDDYVATADDHRYGCSATTSTATTAAPCTCSGTPGITTASCCPRATS